MSELVRRDEKIAYLGIGATIYRMTNFTDFSNSKNPREYTRQYVDKSFEDSDVLGYSHSIAYGFDQYTDNPVHTAIADIHDNEKKGTDAEFFIYVVDKTTAGSMAGSYKCKKRKFVVIPDADGDGTDAYTYSGTLKVKGAIINGEAATTDDWATITFTPDSGATYLVTFSVADASGQIAGALIVINGQLIATNANGIASLELANATYAYSVIKSGYTTDEDSVIVASAAEFVEVTLVAAA